MGGKPLRESEKIEGYPNIDLYPCYKRLIHVVNYTTD